MSRITDDLNKRTRQLENQKLEKGEELVQNSQYQNQIQAINGERMKNLAIERQDAQIQGQGLETMAMAGAMATQDSAGGVTGEMVSPQTQATLSKYGLVGQPRIQRQSHRDVQVKPNNIVINNTYNTTTTNNVSGGGPIQGRPVQISAAATTEAKSQGRFKAWLENAFAQQKEANAKRTKEYEKREWSLSKSVNKMLRKMEDSTREIGRALDPRGIGTTIGSQLKTLMWLFGIHFLAKNWDKVMEIGAWIYKGIGNLISYLGIGEEGRKRRAACTDIMGDLFWFLTGDRKKARDGKTSLLTVFKDIFKSFGDYIKLWFEKQMELRAVAVKQIQKPEFNWKDLGGSIAAIGTYLGDILQAIVAPGASAERSLNKNISAQADSSSALARQREGTNAFKGFNDGSNTMYGDYALEAGGQKRYTNLEYAVDATGKLREGVGVSVGQGLDVLGAYNDARNYGVVDISRVYSGIQRLLERSKQDGSVILDGEFIDRMFGPGAKLSGRFQPVRTKYIRVENDALMNRMQDEYTGLSSDIGSRTLQGAGIGAAAGTVAGGQTMAGTAIGAGVGFVTGVGEHLIHGAVSDDNYLKLVAEDDPKYKDVPPAVFNGQSMTRQDYYRIKAEDFEELMQRWDPNNTKSKDVIFQNIRQDLVNYGGGEHAINQRYNLVGRSSNFGNQYMTNLDEAMKGYREYDRINTEYNNRLDNSRLAVETRAFGQRAMTAGNYVVGAVGQGIQFAGDLMGVRISGGGKGQADKQTMAYRKNYLMTKLTNAGLNRGAASGIIGNLLGEGLVSRDTGAMYSDGSPRHPDGRAFGIAGFNTYGDAPNLQRWASQNGRDWRQFETQADYIAQHPTIQKIIAATEGKQDADSLWQATYIWGHDYERFMGHDPADRTGIKWGEYRKRESFGKGVYNEFSGVDLNSINLASPSQYNETGLYPAQQGNLVGAAPVYSTTYTAAASPISIQPSLLTGGISAQGALPETGIDVRSSGSGAGEIKGFVALAGDSYAVGMASHFKKYLKEKNIESKATCWPGGAVSKDGFYCVSGARIENITMQLQNVLRDKASVIVIHGGMNNWGEDENTITQKLLGMANAASSGGAKVFLIAPIHGQTKAGLSEAAEKVARAVRNVCNTGGYGLIDLEPSSAKYTRFDNEGIHPVGGYATMAKDVVELLMLGGGMTSLVQENSPSEETGYIGSDGFDFGFGGQSAGTYLVGLGTSLQNGIFNVESPEQTEAIRNNGLLRNEAVEILARAKDAGFLFNNVRTEKVKNESGTEEEKELGWDLSKFLKSYDQEGFMEFWTNLAEEERNEFRKRYGRFLDLHERALGLDNNKVIFDNQGSGGAYLTGAGFENKNKYEGQLEQILGRGLEEQGRNDYMSSSGAKSQQQRNRERLATIYNLILSGRIKEADELATYANDYGAFGGKQAYDTFDLSGRDTIDGFEHGEDSRKFYYNTYKYGLIHGQDYLNMMANYMDAKRQINDLEENDPKRGELNRLIAALEKRKSIYEAEENNLSASSTDSSEIQVAVMDRNQKRAAGQVRLLDLQESRDRIISELTKARENGLGLMEWYDLYEQQCGAIDREIEQVQVQLAELEGASSEEIEELRKEVERHKNWEAASKEEITNIFNALDINDDNYWEKVQFLYEKYGKSALDRLGVTVDEMKQIMDLHEKKALETFTAEQKLLYIRLQKFKAALDAAEKISAFSLGTNTPVTALQVYNALNNPGRDFNADYTVAKLIKENHIDISNPVDPKVNGVSLDAVDPSKYYGPLAINPVADREQIARSAGYGNYNFDQSVEENVKANPTGRGTGANGVSDFKLYEFNASTYDFGSDWRTWGKKKAEGGWTPDDLATAPYHQVNGKWEYGTAQGSRFGYLEGGDVTFHGGEYVIPKYMTQIPAVRADINKWEQYRTSTIAGQKVGDGLVKEPVDYSAMMVAHQEATNELLSLIARTNSSGFNKVADVTAATATPPVITPPSTRTFNYK